MDDTAKKIVQIKLQLIELKKFDGDKTAFGADSHHYKLNPVVTEHQLQAFEVRYKITLPQDYRLFLFEIGNGGAGPYYGIQPLEESLYACLGSKNDSELINPAELFPYTETWNMTFSGDVENLAETLTFEQEYFATKHASGALNICNFGCGASFYLIVNGDEYGNIWFDGRGSDASISPEQNMEQSTKLNDELSNELSDKLCNEAVSNRINFLTWYQQWLEAALGECEN